MAAKFNILIVEQDDSIFNLLKDILDQEGHYKIWRVESGREALKLLKNKFFVIVITEVRIEDINGIKFIEKVRTIDNRTNVVALTAPSFVDSKISALKAGAYACLTKPINSEEARIIIKRTIKNTCLFIEVSKKKHYQNIAVFDGLTMVYNHRYFHEFLSWQISHVRRSPQSFALFMIDIDDFKKYNDSKGHPAGDKVLRAVAQMFLDATREEDLVFRYGGEEFAIILPRTICLQAEKVGQRIVRRARQKLPVTISMGLAVFPDHTQKKNELVERADKALYRAKEKGKDQIVVYNPEMDN
ncbi:MAG: diguanylate cyclase [Candidatus Omnitrophica bacterium]|nr:diguanylate cyclase [Candidatus Omnitrophota bacterium]